MKAYQWQKEALEAWKESKGRMTVAAVTGAGKTHFADMVVQHESRRLDASRKNYLCVHVVVPTRALMVQWRDAIDAAFVPDAKPQKRIGRTGGGSIKGWPNCVVYERVVQWNIVSLNAMREGKHTWAPYDADNLVIVDECHNLRGEKSSRALDNIPEDAKVLGLSATPHPSPEAAQIVERLCGPIGYRYRYAQALQDGVIPPFVLKAVALPLSREERSEVDSITDTLKSVMRSANREHGAERNRLLAIAKACGLKRKRALNAARSRIHMALRVVNHHGPDVPTMLFHNTTEAVDRLAELSHHLNPAVYHSNLSADSPFADVEDFVSGDTNHLYSCLALTEGFNVPRVKVAIMMSGPNAPLKRIQTLGRCLRGRSDEPNVIYFFYIKGTKDEDGLHNLLREGDIPSEVVEHYAMNDEWMEPTSPPAEARNWWQQLCDDVDNMTADDFFAEWS